MNAHRIHPQQCIPTIKLQYLGRGVAGLRSSSRLARDRHYCGLSSTLMTVLQVNWGMSGVWRWLRKVFRRGEQAGAPGSGNALPPGQAEEGLPDEGGSTQQNTTNAGEATKSTTNLKKGL